MSSTPDSTYRILRSEEQLITMDYGLGGCFVRIVPPSRQPGLRRACITPCLPPIVIFSLRLLVILVDSGDPVGRQHLH